jgi:tetratricopeptide (TPR) repeat protein
MGPVWALAELGEFTEGIARGEDAVRIADMVGQPFSVVASHSFLSDLYLIKGDIKKALPMLEHSLRVCRDARVLTFFSRVKASLGYAYVHVGRVADGLPLLEEAVARPTMGTFYTRQLSWLSEACLLKGSRAKAIEVNRHALDIARNNKERGNEAYALRILGEIAARENPLDIGKAEDHYRQALTLAEELGMRPLIAHCHVGLGKLYRRTGNLEQAKKHLTDGVAMMREMQMGLWLERAEAELKELQ